MEKLKHSASKGNYNAQTSKVSLGLTIEEKQTPWEYKQFGKCIQNALINTFQWSLTLHFGIKGKQEHQSMKTENFK